MYQAKSEITVAGLLVACASFILPATARGQALAPAAQPRQEVAPASPNGAVPSDRPEDRAAIFAVGEAFTRAYNAGDSKALAAMFTEDAEIIDEDGGRIRGRSEIDNAYAALFRARPGAAVEISRGSLRFLGPDVATEEGHTRVKLQGGTARNTKALYVALREAGRAVAVFDRARRASPGNRTARVS